MLSASAESIDWHVYSTAERQDFDDAALPFGMVRLPPETRRLGQRLGDRFPPSRKFNTVRWRLGRPREARRLIRRVLHEHGPDLIAIGRWCEQAHFWCRACRDLGVPYVIFAYGLELVEEQPNRFAEGRRLDVCSAHALISISRPTSDIMAGLGAEASRMALIPPGIDPGRLTALPADRCRAVLADLGLAGRRFILAMGRLIHRKGFDLAVRALAELAGDYPDVCLAVAGDGDARGEIEAAVAETALGDRVCLLGEVDNEQKLALFQQCEFYAMPNRPVPGDMEGFGIVFLEAGVFGKAVIGGDNGGVPDAVVDGETGFLVDTSAAVEPLVQSLRRLLDDPELASRLGQAGRERALRDFTWDSLARRLVAGLAATCPEAISAANANTHGRARL